MRTTKPREHSLFLKVFRAYIQYVNSGLYFKKEHVVGIENVPANGTPVIVVANHQNCLNDPLCVCCHLVPMCSTILYSTKPSGQWGFFQPTE